jgi:hypothetical protein
MAFKYFKISSGKIIIADPCYTRLAMLSSNLITNVANGVWTAETNSNNVGQITALTVYNNIAQILNPSITTQVYIAPEIPFLIHVNSGEAGFFDADQFKLDTAITDEPLDNWLDLDKPGNKFHAACIYLKHSDEQWGTLHCAALAKTPYGDGTFKALGLKNNIGDYVALTLLFIESIEDYSDDTDDDIDDDDEEDI